VLPRFKVKSSGRGRPLHTTHVLAYVQFAAREAIGNPERAAAVDPTLRKEREGWGTRMSLIGIPPAPLVAGVGGDVGELPEAAEVGVGVQGAFDCACGFIKRIRMLRSG
jgi:hypothetical protein